MGIAVKMLYAAVLLLAALVVSNLQLKLDDIFRLHHTENVQHRLHLCYRPMEEPSVPRLTRRSRPFGMTTHSTAS